LQQAIRGASYDDEILLGALPLCRVSRTQVGEAGANAAISERTAARAWDVESTDLTGRCSQCDGEFASGTQIYSGTGSTARRRDTNQGPFPASRDASRIC
jgi:hypothetical protein